MELGEWGGGKDLGRGGGEKHDQDILYDEDGFSIKKCCFLSGIFPQQQEI